MACAPAPDRQGQAACAAQETLTMSQAIEVKVPDIGDYKDIPVIEVLVKAGDTV
jgi:pyruvate dehydrogenase E2 component (dihydrolipoamide acetyltransferase)